MLLVAALVAVLTGCQVDAHVDVTMAEDGSGAARIEEEVVVTKDGCQIITNFPSDRLISCGLPGCEVF